MTLYGARFGIASSNSVFRFISFPHSDYDTTHGLCSLSVFNSTLVTNGLTTWQTCVLLSTEECVVKCMLSARWQSNLALILAFILRCYAQWRFMWKILLRL